jgi:hypothetical protein
MNKVIWNAPRPRGVGTGCRQIGEETWNMTATPETSDDARDVVAPAQATLQSVSLPAVLITEQEVLLSTVAAVPAESTPTRWWTDVTRVIAAALRRMALTSRADSRKVRGHVPERYYYLERALMSREMGRL